MNEERPEMLTAAFADAHEYPTVAAGVLAWHEAQPRCHMPTVLKIAPIADRSNHGSGRYWKTKYGGLMPSEMKRLKQLEEENGKLKKLVADLALDKEMLQDVIRRKI